MIGKLDNYNRKSTPFGQTLTNYCVYSIVVNDNKIKMARKPGKI